MRRGGATGYNRPELYQSAFKKVLAALQDNQLSSGKLLELGCGSGDLSLLLADRGYEVCGIDISPTAVSWAREKGERRYPKVNFRLGDVLNLPYEHGYFDVVIDALCLHCIIGEDRLIFFENVRAVLKQHGLFVVMTKCGDPRDEAYPFDSVTRCKIEDGRPTRYWGLPGSLRREIEGAGFKIVNWRVFYEYAQPLFFAQAVKSIGTGH